MLKKIGSIQNKFMIYALYSEFKGKIIPDSKSGKIEKAGFYLLVIY